ncbi:MAG: DNA-formamidopyrimidine glycosylase family protein, partial [Pseudomonadota bacterium]
MPELPEVETVRRGLAPVMEGAVVTAVRLARPDLRFPFPQNFAGRLEGRRILSLGRRAKYLVAELDDGVSLIMHLGMSGAFRVDDGSNIGAYVHDKGKLAAHDHVRIHMGRPTVIYNDPRRFGFMTLAETGRINEHPHFVGMGVEPLPGSLTAHHLAVALRGKVTPLKSALLDQRII